MANSRRWALLLVFCLFVSLCAQPSTACTDFRLNASDGTVVVGRSMEWGADLNSRVNKYPRGVTIQSKAPGDLPGLKWVSKFGYLAVDGGSSGPTLDGMNEKGLSIGFLWLPGSKYHDLTKGDEARAISLVDFGDWLLGNFSSVDEAKAALKNVKIWAPSLKDWGGIPTIHVSLHDAAGKSAVFEFTDGELKIFDNQLGVLTNAPTFDWQCKNLENYFELTPYSDKGAFFNLPNAKLVGQGGGLLGMPGNPLPSSRFIHTAAYKSFAKQPADNKNAVILAQHILNSVDIPLGVVRTASGDDKYCDFTQWILIKDLKNKEFHYRSYSDISLHTIKLDQLDFSEDAKRKSIPIAGETFFCDMSASLK